MAKYNVHFTGFYGYDVEVEAENEEQAERLADAIFDEVDPNEFFFEAEHPDIWEVED